MEELLMWLLGVQKIHSSPKSLQPSPCEQAAPARGGGCCRTQQPGDRFFFSGSQRTEGAKQTAWLPQEQSHSRGHTSWRCPRPGPQACWQPHPMRLSHQAHSAAGFWPKRVSISPHPRVPFLLTVSLGSLPGTQRSGCLQLLPRG